ncbi:MAG: hypothetical protein WCA07_15550 [Gloeobacterales cyanobacterium]
MTTLIALTPVAVSAQAMAPTVPEGSARPGLLLAPNQISMGSSQNVCFLEQPSAEKMALESRQNALTNQMKTRLAGPLSQTLGNVFGPQGIGQELGQNLRNAPTPFQSQLAGNASNVFSAVLGPEGMGAMVQNALPYALRQTAYQPNPAVVCGKGILLSTGQVVYTPGSPGSVGQPIILASPNGSGLVPSSTSTLSGKAYRGQVQSEIINR